ncbi:MAG: DUF4926 domain-containing protein [Ignavibacteriales bacterium]|nr:DUF4926 domain-containing protein [Ignavibacteriales bacterium]
MIHLHDFVALLDNIPNTTIIRGTTGTVVSQLSDNFFLVEFSDENGEVFEQLPIQQDSLLVLHRISENAEFANP